jgi:hypothetical protein
MRAVVPLDVGDGGARSWTWRRGNGVSVALAHLIGRAVLVGGVLGEGAGGRVAHVGPLVHDRLQRAEGGGVSCDRLLYSIGDVYRLRVKEQSVRLLDRAEHFVPVFPVVRLVRGVLGGCDDPGSGETPPLFHCLDVLPGDNLVGHRFALCVDPFLIGGDPFECVDLFLFDRHELIGLLE